MNYSPLHWGWGRELNMLTTFTAVFWWPSLWKTTITARKWIFRLILLIVVTWTLQLPVRLAAREGFFVATLSDFAIIYKWECVWQVCHPPHWLPSQTVASLTPNSNTNLKHATSSCHTSAKRASALRTQIKLVGHLLPSDCHNKPQPITWYQKRIQLYILHQVDAESEIRFSKRCH